MDLFRNFIYLAHHISHGHGHVKGPLHSRQGSIFHRKAPRALVAVPAPPQPSDDRSLAISLSYPPLRTRRSDSEG